MLKLTNLNTFYFNYLEWLILNGVIEIMFCSKTNGWGVSDEKQNTRVIQYLPFELTNFKILKL